MYLPDRGSQKQVAGEKIYVIFKESKKYKIKSVTKNRTK